jgi:prepilin-type N-terminal cleavage/methylation domain-containing protein/prepilin-type processing-associated H-X9-DG protein
MTRTPAGMRRAPKQLMRTTIKTLARRIHRSYGHFSSMNTTNKAGTNATGGGFTLIELLAAIAVIAVLAALLMPAVSGGIRKARMTTCSANQRQIGMAFILYASDRDQLLPPVCNISAGWQIWPYFLIPYAGESQFANYGEHRPGYQPPSDVWNTIFICPSFTEEFPKQTLSQKILGGYGMNRRLPPNETKDEDPGNAIYGNDWVAQYQSRGRLSSVGDLAQRILVADGSGANGDLETYWQAKDPNSLGISKKRHNNGAIISYMDGHNALMAGDEIVTRAKNESDKKKPMLFRSGDS